MKKNCERTTKGKFRKKNLLRKKMANYILNGKDMIIHLIAGLIRMILHNNESILS